MQDCGLVAQYQLSSVDASWQGIAMMLLAGNTLAEQLEKRLAAFVLVHLWIVNSGEQLSHACRLQAQLCFAPTHFTSRARKRMRYACSWVS